MVMHPLRIVIVIEARSREYNKYSVTATREARFPHLNGTEHCQNLWEFSIITWAFMTTKPFTNYSSHLAVTDVPTRRQSERLHKNKSISMKACINTGCFICLCLFKNQVFSTFVAFCISMASSIINDDWNF